MEEFTVFIKVKIDNLKEFSNEIPEIVKRRFNNKRVIINNNNDKKSVIRSIIAKLNTSIVLNPINSLEITKKNSLMPIELGVIDAKVD